MLVLPTQPILNGKLSRETTRRKLDHEIKLDKRILENLASQNVGMEGMKLSRFDKVLGLNRERIERIYRGKTAA